MAVTEQMLDNAIEIAKEEIMNPEAPTKGDLEGFKKRMNGLLDKLIEDADDEDDD